MDAVLAEMLPSGTPLGEVADEMRAAHDAAWRAVDHRLLSLCRYRTAMLLGCDAERTGLDPDTAAALPRWPSDPQFSPAERAALAFTEEYLIDVAALGDDTAAALRTHLGDDGLHDFVTALLVVEQRIRLRLAWARLFEEVTDGA